MLVFGVIEARPRPARAQSAPTQPAHAPPAATLPAAATQPTATRPAPNAPAPAKPAQTQPAPDDRRTVTYRLLSFNAGSAAGIPLGLRQIGQIADLVIDNAADIVGLCEMELGTAWHDGRAHVAELAVALADRGYPMHIYEWPSIQIQGGWQTPALLTRWPIDESGYDVIDPPAGFRWCVGHVTIRVAENTPVRAYMTHIWPQGSPEASAAAVWRVASLHHAFNGPATIMGDFNLTPDSGLFKVITAEGWRSSCDALGRGPCPAVQGTAGVSGPLPLLAQIDYVFGNEGVQFVDGYVPYFSPSDHWAVVAEVRVAANGPPLPTGLPNTSASRLPGGVARATAARLYRAHDYAGAAEAFDAMERATADRDAAAYAAFSSASMRWLAGDAEAGAKALAQVAARYARSDWAARARYRRAFLLKQARQFADAEGEFVRALAAYYEFVDTDVKSPMVRLIAAEIAECRKAQSKAGSPNGVLEELADRNPRGTVARAAAYALAYAAQQANDHDRVARYLRQARPTPHGLWHDQARVIAEAWLEIGDTEQADLFYAQFLAGLDDPLHRRIRAAQWDKRRHPDRYVFSVPHVPLIRVDGDVSDWGVPPIARLEGPQHVYLRGGAEAGSDLAATVYVGWADDALYIAADVTDAVHSCPFRGAEIFRGDCIQVAIDPNADGGGAYDQNDFEFGAALTDRGPQLWVWTDPSKRDWSKARVAIRRVEKRTIYEIALPTEMIRAGGGVPERIGMDVLVNDSNDGERTCWVDWTPGIAEAKRPDLFPLLLLRSGRK